MSSISKFVRIDTYKKRLCEVCRHNYKFHETTPAHQRSLWIFLSQNGALAITTILLRCLRVILVILKPCDRFGPSDLLCLVNYRRKRVGDPLLQDAVLGKKLMRPRRCHGSCKKVPRTMNLRPSKLSGVYWQPLNFSNEGEFFWSGHQRNVPSPNSK